MPYTGNWNCGCGSSRYGYPLGKAAFNAVLDVGFSDSTPSGGGSAQILNATVQGPSYQNDSLIGATIYLLFLDGSQYVNVPIEDSFSDPLEKEFKFYPSDDPGSGNPAGTVVFSFNIDDPVLETIFYVSAATAFLPGAEPVTVAEFKLWAKLDTGSLDDDIITDLIATARQQCEDYTGMSIVARTVTAQLNNSCGGIFLPYCPFISLVSIKDYAGNVIDTTGYELSNKYTPSLLFPQLLTPWSDNVTLVYTAGYGLPPAKIITAIKQQTFFLYENRGENPEIYRGVEAAITMSPQAIATLQRLRRVSWI